MRSTEVEVEVEVEASVRLASFRTLLGASNRRGNVTEFIDPGISMTCGPPLAPFHYNCILAGPGNLDKEAPTLANTASYTA